MRRENRLEFGVHLDGHHAGSFLHKCERQRANAWPHLEHALGARKLSQRHNALDDMIVDKEVLTQAVLGRQAERFEHLARCRGVRKRGCGHTRSIQKLNKETDRPKCPRLPQEGRSVHKARKRRSGGKVGRLRWSVGFINPDGGRGPRPSRPADRRPAGPRRKMRPCRRSRPHPRSRCGAGPRRWCSA